MKLSVTRRALAEASSSVAKAASTKTTLPILGHILLTASEAGLRLSATDLQIGIQREIPAEVSEEGQATVPAKTFVDLVGVEGNGDMVDMELLKKSNALKLKFGKMTSKIKGFSPEEFPILGAADESGVKFYVEELRDLISKTAFAASNDFARPVLEGVLFRFEENQLVMAAADGFRLSKVSAPLPEFAGDGKPPMESVILPAKALRQLSVLLGSRETVSMSMVEESSSRVAFSCDDFQMTIARIEGAFPDFDSIIPDSHKASATFSTEVGLKAAKAAYVFAQLAGNLVKLSLNGEAIEISSQDSETGSNETTITPDQIEGDEMVIGFNVKMLIDFLSIKNGGDAVIFESEGANKPGVFRYQGNADFSHIIMPMNVSK